MIVYKYRTWTDKQEKMILTDNIIYLSKLSDLDKDNPYEGRLPIRFDLVEDDYLRKRIKDIAQIDPYISKQEVEDAFNERKKDFLSKDYQEKIKKQWFEELDESLGVLCLSQSNVDVDLWKLFANNYKGFCVGLDLDILRKDEDSFGTFGEV